MHVTYPDRESWLAAKKKSIGASEQAAILQWYLKFHAPDKARWQDLNLGCWRSAYTIWAEKLGIIEPQPMTKHMKMGLFMEPTIAALYQDEAREEVIAPPPYTIFYHDEFPFIACTPDRFLEPAKPLELKWTNKSQRKFWEDDTAPFIYRVQLYAQMDVLNATSGALAALVKEDEDLIRRKFDRNDRYIKHMRRACSLFWEYLQTETMPERENTESDRETWAAQYPQDDGEVIEIVAPVDGWIQARKATAEAKQNLAAAEKHEEELGFQIVQAMGTASVGFCGDARVTLKTQKSGQNVIRIDPQYLDQIEAAGIPYKLQEQKTTRVLREG